MRDGRLSLEARNVLLAEMTDDVAALVLRNNYLQPLSLSLAEQRGLEDLGFQQRLMQSLEAAGELDRSVEFLPDDKEIAERRRRSQAAHATGTLGAARLCQAIARPSSWSNSSVPDDPYLARELARYFPKAIVEKFPDALDHHRLRREIIATQLSNSMINRGGPTLVVRIADQTGASAASIAAAFAAVRDSYGMTALNTAIDGLDNKISGKLQLDLYMAVQNLLLDRLVWFLRNVDLSQGLAAIVEHYRDGIAAVEAALGSALSPEAATARTQREVELKAAGVPEELAQPAREPAGACRRARHRAGGRAHRAKKSPRWPPPISPPNPSSGSTASRARRATSRSPTISIGSRSTARSIRSATPSAGSPPRWPAMERPAPRRSRPGWSAPSRGRAHSHLGARDRQFRAHAVEALGRGEPAWRSRQAVTLSITHSLLCEDHANDIAAVPNAAA